MAYRINNINLRGRLTQIIILLTFIIGGVLFSQIAHAQNQKKFDKPKFRTQVHKYANKVCSILNKKRQAKHKNTLFASNKGSKRAKRNKPMAETDSSSN